MDLDPVAPKSSFATVRVRVLDVNDVPPTFTAPEYRVKVREDLPVGSVVGMVDAKDPDQYQGGQVGFSFLPEHDDANDFDIDVTSGTIRIKRELDYEQKQFYNLTVKVRKGLGFSFVRFIPSRIRQDVFPTMLGYRPRLSSLVVDVVLHCGSHGC